MRRTTSRLVVAGAIIGASSLALTACGGGQGGGGEGADPDTAQEAWESEEEVTISISDLPLTSIPEVREARLNQIADFEEQNPHITIEPEETTWAADTFPTMVASDTVPTLMNIPFTEMQPMIQRGQAADVTEFVALDEAIGNSNESLVDLTIGPDDQQYGIPMDGYSMALYYNRTLFEEVGLDPDSPPADWDEVREAGKTINDETDAQGFVFMSMDNTGGWVFTPIANGFGGQIVSEDGTEATLDDPGVQAALEFYRDVRWEDDAAGSNFLIAFDDANQVFASGQAGMYVAPGNQYANIVTSLGMDPDELGMAPLPQTSDGIGTLAGGTHGLINPNATPEEMAAAVKWVSYYRFGQFTDEETAVSSAEALAADGAPVAVPGVPLVGNELQDQWLEWIDDEINIPRENYTDYIESVTPGSESELALIPEPAIAAQQIYSVLDTAIQTVLTEEDADIEALLDEAQTQAQNAIDENTVE